MKNVFRIISRRQKPLKGLRRQKELFNNIELLHNKLYYEITIFRKFSKFVCDEQIKVTSKGIEDIDKLKNWEYMDEFFRIYDPLNNIRILDVYNEKITEYNFLLKTLITD